LPPNRASSDHDLFTRVNDEMGADLGQDTTNKPISYAHFNFDQSTKQQLAKGNSMVSMSSESVDVPINNGEATRRKVHTTSPPDDPLVESSPGLLKTNKVKLRKQTQDIAARAAQRRANLHHKELMEDMGKHFFFTKNEFHSKIYLFSRRISVFIGTCCIKRKYCQCLRSGNNRC
jgi:hypothetical protein